MASSPVLSKKVAAELVGTFVFVLVGAGSSLGTIVAGGSDQNGALLVAGLGNGLGLAMAISATMGVSGGVLNPAVAVGLFVGKKLPAGHVIPYILAELIGATAAGLALVLAFPSVIGQLAHYGAPTLSGLVNVWQGIAIEALLTFVLVTAVYGTAVDPRAPKIGGLGVGLAVLVDVLVGGPLTGAAMNPARAMGPMIAGWFFPSYWYIYWVGPLVGAAAAGLFYRFAVE